MSRGSEAVSERLAAPLLRTIADLAGRRAGPVLVVGGFVRDALLGRAAADVDIVVGDDFEAFVEAFARQLGRRPVPIGDRWRDTHRTRCGTTQVDIARLLGSVDEDLRQRDFTINAMAVRLGTSSLIDPHGGSVDLERGAIRMLSADVLDRDPLRLLRAVRYAITLDGFVIEEETCAALGARAPTIGDVAAERVQSEWRQILESDRWTDGLELAAELGLAASLVDLEDLSAAHAWAAAAATATGESAPAGARHLDPDRLVADRLAAILLGDATSGAAARHLELRRWPRSIARAAERIAQWAARVEIVDEETLIEWALDDHDAARRAAALAGAVAHADAGRSSEGVRRLTTFVERAGESRWVRGADLRDWGMPAGERLGAVVRQAARDQVARRWQTAAAARAWAMQVARGGTTAPRSVDV